MSGVVLTRGHHWVPTTLENHLGYKQTPNLLEIDICPVVRNNMGILDLNINSASPKHRTEQFGQL